MFFDENFLELRFLNLAFVTKAFFVLFLIFYVVFSLVLFRQVQLMEKTLPLSLSPLLTFIAILQIGVAVALLFIVLQVF